MAVIVTFDLDEIQKIMRQEISRRYNCEVEDFELDCSDEVIKITLGAKMAPERGGPGDL